MTTELADRIHRLEAMAQGWDRCAAQHTGDISRGRPETYREWAAACRAKADHLRNAS